MEFYKCVIEFIDCCPVVEFYGTLYYFQGESQDWILVGQYWIQNCPHQLQHWFSDWFVVGVGVEAIIADNLICAYTAKKIAQPRRKNSTDASAPSARFSISVYFIGRPKNLQRSIQFCDCRLPPKKYEHHSERWETTQSRDGKTCRRCRRVCAIFSPWLC